MKASKLVFVVLVLSACDAEINGVSLLPASSDAGPSITFAPDEAGIRGSTFTRADATTRIGIFYALHHCYTLNEQREAMMKRYGPSGDYGDLVLDVHKIENDPARSFGPHLAKHYWAEPEEGYYCLSDAGDPNDPSKPSGRQVLERHAKMLRDAGIDHIIVDSTNHAYVDGRSHASTTMILDPLDALLEVWSTIPNAPKVVPWVPLPVDGDMWSEVTSRIAKYPNLVLHYEGKPLLAYVDWETPHDQRFKASAQLVEKLRKDFTLRKMWRKSPKDMAHLVATGQPAKQEAWNDQWSFTTPCSNHVAFQRSGARAPCKQSYSVHSANDQIVEHVSVTSAYQMYFITDDKAVPKFHGRTLVRQFATVQALPSPPRFITIAQWNVWVAMRFDPNYTGKGALPPDQREYCWKGVYANKRDAHCFVDEFRPEYNRDLEPSKVAGDRYYTLMKDSISALRGGLSLPDADAHWKRYEQGRRPQPDAGVAPAPQPDSRVAPQPDSGVAPQPDQSVPDTPSRLLGSIAGFSKAGDTELLRGWACEERRARSTQIHVYVGNPTGIQNRLRIAMADRPSESALSAPTNCDTGTFRRHRFEVRLSADDVKRHQGKRVWVYALSVDGSRNGKLLRSGQIAVPNAPAAPRDCAAPGGGTIAHGDKRTYYRTQKSTSCHSTANSQSRQCTDGRLSGSYTFTSCSAFSSCAAPGGGTIAHGDKRTYYLAQKSASCHSTANSQSRQCTDGRLSGSYTFTSCSAFASCAAPGGGTIAHGDKRTYYLAQKSASCHSTANSQSRQCTDGRLSGSYTFTSCSAFASCAAPGGGTIADGGSQTYFALSQSSRCNSLKETRTCTDGRLSGSYGHLSCHKPPAGALVGIIDSFQKSGGRYYLKGWACERGHDFSVSVHVYIGQPTGIAYRKAIARAFRASEPAVSAGHNCDSGNFRYHRFTIEFDAATVAQLAGQQVYVYAISEDGTRNDRMSRSGVVTVPLP